MLLPRTAIGSASLDAARAAGVAARQVGSVGGTALKLGDETAVPIATLTARYESWLPDYMAGKT